MNKYASDEYIESKKWISGKIQEGYDWESVKHFCVSSENEQEMFDQLRDEELIIPQNMEFEEWPNFVDEVKRGYSLIGNMYGISANNNSNAFPEPLPPIC